MRFFISCILFLILFTPSIQGDQVIEQDEMNRVLKQAESALKSQDYNQAYELFEQASQWGHNGAQYVLGNMHLLGKGTAHDPVTGTAWLSIAAESQRPEFRDAHLQALQSLDEQQKSDALQLSRQLSGLYGNEISRVHCRRQKPAGSNFYTTLCQHRTAGHGLIYVPDAAAVERLASP